MKLKEFIEQFDSTDTIGLIDSVDYLFLYTSDDEAIMKFGDREIDGCRLAIASSKPVIFIKIKNYVSEKEDE